jgi:hypothetical protein
MQVVYRTNLNFGLPAGITLVSSCHMMIGNSMLLYDEKRRFR